MDFAASLERVAGCLSAAGHRWVIVGGVGLAAYGLGRTTLDLDVATELAAQPSLVAHLESLGYETLHLSRSYSNHLHAEPRWGRLDFVYVEGETAERLFGAARAVPGPGGAPVPVAAPEHLAAMKVQAIRNDPSRSLQDLSDLRFLLRLPGIDREQVRGYFERYGLLPAYEELVSEA